METHHVYEIATALRALSDSHENEPSEGLSRHAVLSAAATVATTVAKYDELFDVDRFMYSFGAEPWEYGTSTMVSAVDRWLCCHCDRYFKFDNGEELCPECVAHGVTVDA